MAEAVTKLPVKDETTSVDRPGEWRPFEMLRREMDRLLDDFQLGSWRSPFRRSMFDLEPFWRGKTTWGKAPAVDVWKKTKPMRSRQSCPGLTRTILGSSFGRYSDHQRREKRREGREEEGLRSLRAPLRLVPTLLRRADGVDVNKIEANFKNGVLTVTLPKTPEAQKSEKKIAVKAA